MEIEKVELVDLERLKLIFKNGHERIVFTQDFNYVIHNSIRFWSGELDGCSDEDFYNQAKLTVSDYFYEKENV